jgi:hypothetical protein
MLANRTIIGACAARPVTLNDAEVQNSVVEAAL